MKIDKLVLNKNIYPRGRDKENDNEIKPDDDQIKRYREYIEEYNKIPNKNGNITYNKRTMNVLDGFHRILAAQQSGWTEIPDKDLVAMDIPIEKELWVSAMLNNDSSKQLSRAEIKAVLKAYWEKGDRLKYGTIKDFMKDFAVSKSTIYNWLDDFKTKAADRPKLENTVNDRLKDKEEEIKDQKQKYEKQITELEYELETVKKKAKEDIINLLCKEHQQQVKVCKNCGK